MHRDCQIPIYMDLSNWLLLYGNFKFNNFIHFWASGKEECSVFSAASLESWWTCSDRFSTSWCSCKFFVRVSSKRPCKRRLISLMLSSPPPPRIISNTRRTFNLSPNTGWLGEVGVESVLSVSKDTLEEYQ